MKLETAAGTKSVPVSTWAGAYTRVFCVHVLKSAEKYLNNWGKRSLEAFPVDVSDEDIEESEMEPPPASWSAR